MIKEYLRADFKSNFKKVTESKNFNIQKLLKAPENPF
jgi:hypothetical protein